MLGVAADALVVVHFAFVAFVLLGALLVVRWRWLAVLHVPAFAWGAWIEFCGGTCPLTPLEQRLRVAAGEAGYSGGFIEHYLLPILYPAGLTAATQQLLGALVVALNLALYLFVVQRLRSR